jgi:hypothetical protein
MAILNCLTKGKVPFTEEEVLKADIITQERFEEGQPDICLDAPGSMVIVEVKVERRGDFHIEQYRSILKSSAAACSCLVILTRYAENFPEGNTDRAGGPPVIAARWYRVADCLSELQKTTSDSVTKYLMDEFWCFLDRRGITMERVRVSLLDGARDLGSLMSMLSEAIASCGGKLSQGGVGRKAMGRYFHKQKVKYWSGLYYDEPWLLLLQVEVLNDATKAARAKQLGFTGITRDNSPAWREVSRDLKSSPYDFFNQPKERQIEIIEEFLKENTTF